jgi:hypothetical protein
MRKVLIGLAVLAGAATALVVTCVFCANRIIAVNRDRIVQHSATELGRPVSVERITLGLWRGISLQLDNLRITDDPRFGDGDFVRARTLRVVAKLWPLLRRQFVAELIDARDPYVHLVRDPSGRWNYETLGAHRPDARPSTSAAGTLTRFAVSAARLQVHAIHAGRLEGTTSATPDPHPFGGSAAMLQDMLEGGLTIDIRDGRVDHLNLVGALLKRISDVPGIGSLIFGRANPKYARLFGEQGMGFETLRASFRVTDERLITEDLAIVAPDYSATAHGWIGFDRNVDLSGTLVMSKRFSDDVLADASVAKYLANGDGQLAIPFRLHGSIGEAQLTPDTTHLQAALERVTHGAAQHLLEKLFGRQGSARPESGPEQQNPIEKGLRELLGH